MLFKYKKRSLSRQFDNNINNLKISFIFYIDKAFYNIINWYYKNIISAYIIPILNQEEIMSYSLTKHIEAFEKYSPRHHLSKLSGIQAAHLVAYKEGRINKPHRNILLKICVALELNFDQFNQVFNEFGLEDIESTDIGNFKEAIRDREIPSGVHQLKPDPIVFEIEIMSIENTPGDVKLVTAYPHRVFDQSAKYEDDIIGKSEAFKSIRDDLLKLRKTNFNRMVSQYEIHHLICEGCLKAYIRENRNNPDIGDNFNEMIGAATDPKKKYKLNIIDVCPYFNFHLKEPMTESIIDDKSIVLFTGKIPIHKNKKRKEAELNELSGFVSTNQEMYRHFSYEFDRLSKFIIDESRDPKILKKYISGI